jgi:peptidyl-prolyl cis-trans isomerase SurA
MPRPPLAVLSPLVLASLLAAPVAAADPPAAGAVLVDRVVAVVEGKTIYRSDVLARARLFEGQLAAAGRTDPEMRRALREELLEKMVDEILIATDLDKSKVTVTPAEVDDVITKTAQQNNMSAADMNAMLAKQGLTLPQFKEELQRQLLDAKWTQLVVRPRVRTPEIGTDQEKLQTLQRLVQEERTKILVELRLRSFVEVRK